MIQATVLPNGLNHLKQGKLWKTTLQYYFQGIVLKYTKTLIPRKNNAALRPYTLFGGEMASVWHDREELSPTGKEDLSGINEMGEHMKQLVQHIEDAGVPR